MADESRNFQIEIITPDRVFYQGEAEMIEFTAVDGDIGILKNHIPLTTVIAPGILTITEAGGKKQAALHSGFAEILPEKATILAEVAEWPDEIDANRAEEAKKRAEDRLKGNVPDIDVNRAEVALKRAMVRMSLKR